MCAYLILLNLLTDYRQTLTAYAVCAVREYPNQTITMVKMIDNLFSIFLFISWNLLSFALLRNRPNSNYLIVADSSKRVSVSEES